MSLSKIYTAMKWLFSRISLAYVLIFIAIISLVDVKAVDSRIKIRRLNDARPSMVDFVAFGKGDLSADKMNWKPYLKYFSLVVKYMPAEKVSRMFLGVCEYYSGDPDKTVWRHMVQSAEEPPYVFWASYNAGIVAFERGDMRFAIRYLERAIAMPLDNVPDAIRGSTAYRQLMAASNFDVDLMKRIAGARENVYLLLSAACFYAKDHARARAVALAALEKIDIQDKEPFYFYIGASSMAMGVTKDALLFLGKCIELKSRNPFVYQYAAEMLKRSGQDEASSNMLKAAQALRGRASGVFPYPDRLKLRFL
jgi:tetratricopeptide (TPR) repeat protein